MAQIQMLDSATINKIAAGEVIERPASIVKELVENAIDAGASTITVDIRDGGISYLRVTDNGAGIAADQVEIAFLRHSTSKIERAEDLQTISSLGFRGEALASIAAVARVEILTRRPEDMTGGRYVIEGGCPQILEEIACPAGTTLRVENLFFNTPARKKFLKKPATEAAYITDFCQKIALGHPEISFKYMRGGGTPILHTPGNHQLKTCVFAVFGKDMLSQLLSLDEPGEISIDGYISKPELTRANRSYENYFLNGRYIKSQVIEKALEEAYKDYVVPGTYPVTVLHIRMNPQGLDVNVHPTKMEVRFSAEEQVKEAVFEAVSRKLRESNLTASLHIDPPKPDPPAVEAEKADPAEEALLAELMRRREALLQREPAAPVKREPPQSEQMLVEETPLPEPEVEARREDQRQATFTLIGQAFRTYWFAESQEQLYIIDQHAAHERVLYDRIRARLRDGKLDSQILLEPEVFSVTEREMLRLEQCRPVFERLGYEMEAFGEDAVLVRAVPYIFNGPLDRQDFQSMVDLCQEGNHNVSLDVCLDRMAMMSCKAAVKGNDAISFQEMKGLLEQLLASENPYNCPHGRPTMITMTRYELERKFKRA